MSKPEHKKIYYENGKLYREEWYLDGKELTEEKFLLSHEHQNYLADLEIDKILEKV